MLARRAERGSRDRGHARIFQQDAADFFRAGTRSANIDPGIESTLGSFAAETRYFIQIVNEPFPAASKLGNHARRSPLAVTQSIDGGILNEFVDAGVG